MLDPMCLESGPHDFWPTFLALEKPRDSATAVYATNHFGRQMLLQLLTEVQHLNRLRILGWKILN